MLLTGGAAMAQTSPQYQPVDQAVGDLDPLSTSMRRVEPGLGQLNEPRLYQMQPSEQMWGSPLQPGNPLGVPYAPVAPTVAGVPGQYHYQEPGVRAWMTRPDYLVRTGIDGRDIALNRAPAVDGEFRQGIPAGTVYDLTLPKPAVVHWPSGLRPGETPRAMPVAADRPWDLPQNEQAGRLETRLDLSIELRSEPPTAQ